MKTAEQWNKELDPRMGIEERESDIDRIRKIQLDAIREGMSRAAKMVIDAKWQKGSMNFNQGFISGNILSTAENLSEKDL